MKNKLKKIELKKALIVLMATFCCLNLQAKGNQSIFKIAVVEDAIGTQEIMKGRYRLGLEKLSTKSARSFSQYDIAMGECVAKLMIKQLTQASESCSNAIEVYKSKKGSQYRYLTSVAYSNRAVAQYKLGKINSALKDLELAASIDDNDIVLENLTFLKSKLEKISSKTETSQETIAAD